MIDRPEFEAYLSALTGPFADHARAMWARLIEVAPNLRAPAAGCNDDRSAFYLAWNCKRSDGVDCVLTIDWENGLNGLAYWWRKNRETGRHYGDEVASDALDPMLVEALKWFEVAP